MKNLEQLVESLQQEVTTLQRQIKELEKRVNTQEIQTNKTLRKLADEVARVRVVATNVQKQVKHVSKQLASDVQTIWQRIKNG